jgi:hypothetical protein
LCFLEKLGWQACHHQTLVEMGSHKLLARLDLNHNPPHFCLLSS